MSQLLKQNQTAEYITFLLVLSSDHITGATGKSPTVTLSKNGGSYGAASGAVTELGNGIYRLAGNATDANTLGPLDIHITATDCDPADIKCQVVAFDPRVALATPTNITAGTITTVTNLTNAPASLATAAELAKVPKAGQTNTHTNTSTNESATVSIT